MAEALQRAAVRGLRSVGRAGARGPAAGWTPGVVGLCPRTAGIWDSAGPEWKPRVLPPRGVRPPLAAPPHPCPAATAPRPLLGAAPGAGAAVLGRCDGGGGCGCPCDNKLR